jgi:hypothetical protein
MLMNFNDHLRAEDHTFVQEHPFDNPVFRAVSAPDLANDLGSIADLDRVTYERASMGTPAPIDEWESGQLKRRRCGFVTIWSSTATIPLRWPDRLPVRIRFPVPTELGGGYGTVGNVEAQLRISGTLNIHEVQHLRKYGRYWKDLLSGVDRYGEFPFNRNKAAQHGFPMGALPGAVTGDTMYSAESQADADSKALASAMQTLRLLAVGLDRKIRKFAGQHDKGFIDEEAAAGPARNPWISFHDDPYALDRAGK